MPSEVSSIRSSRAYLDNLLSAASTDFGNEECKRLRGRERQGDWWAARLRCSATRFLIGALTAACELGCGARPVAVAPPGSTSEPKDGVSAATGTSGAGGTRVASGTVGAVSSSTSQSGNAATPNGAAGTFATAGRDAGTGPSGAAGMSASAGRDAATDTTSIPTVTGSPADRGGPPGDSRFCRGALSEELAVPDAGSGALSGCPARQCVGIVPDFNNATHGDKPDQYVTDLSRYEGCTTVVGDILVNQWTEADLHQLHCLEFVSGTLTVFNSPGLVSLDGLDSLQKVGGALGIGFANFLVSENPKLTSLAALHNLRAVGGNLSLSLEGPPTLHGLEALRVVGGHMAIDSDHPLITAGGSSADVYGGNQLTDLSGLSSLRAVGGEFRLGAEILSMVGMDRLERIAGSMVLGSSNVLPRIDGFPALRCIGQNLELTVVGNNSMPITTTARLPALERIGGDVVIASNPRLQSIELLAHVTELGGSLRIDHNTMLDSIILPQLMLAPMSAIAIHDNPAFPVCPLRAWAAARSAEGWVGTAMLDGNLQGATCK
jgi:hypothetical protein